MESIFIEMAKQVPSLGVLCFIVWIFIRYQEIRDKTIRQMHEEHLDARAESRRALQSNTEAIYEQRDALLKQMSKICQCLEDRNL